MMAHSLVDGYQLSEDTVASTLVEVKDVNPEGHNLNFHCCKILNMNYFFLVSMSVFFFIFPFGQECSCYLLKLKRTARALVLPCTLTV
jgi:hypothetical protein